MPLWWVNADGGQDTQVCGVTEPVEADGEANVHSNQTVHKFYLYRLLYKIIRGVIIRCKLVLG